MFNGFIPRFGISSQIHHDQGQEFENKLFHTLEKYCGTTHTRTTRCHILGGMAGQRGPTKPSLPCYVRYLSHRNLDGRTMSTRRCLPTTLQGMRQQGTHPSSCHLFATQESLSLVSALHTYQLPRTAKNGKYSQHLATKNEDRYDRRTNAAFLEPGDRVLVRKLSERVGPGKLRAL